MENCLENYYGFVWEIFFEFFGLILVWNREDGVSFK